ncbi:MAG: alpha/beta fold hydrolase [Vampirovibrio sp.]|nr:alpha/beta fold hydrolase [Vampirovibrio sp.]
MYIRIILLTALLVTLVFSYRQFEDRQIYYPESVLVQKDLLAAIQDPKLKTKIRDVYFKATDGTRLNAWYVAATDKKPMIVFAHGNAGNIADRWAVMRPFVEAGYGFFVFDYRGYGKSEGSPSEQGVYSDLEGASAFLEKQYGVAVTEQIAMGGSLGGGVVMDVATRLPFKAIIVFSSFTSVPDVWTYQLENRGLGWLNVLPWHWIIQQDFNSLSKTGSVNLPTVIAHGQSDKMIPVSMSKTLYQHLGSRHKRFVVDPNGGHGVSSRLLLSELEQLMKATQPRATSESR